jgi:hypothetical protein
MKKIITLNLILLSFHVFSQPVITSAYNPHFGDHYVYKIVDDTSTAQPGQAGAGVIWNLTAMHGLLSTREYNYKQTALTNDAWIFASHSNMAVEIIIPSLSTRYEYYDVGANFTGDFKKVGSHVDNAITNFLAGYMVFDYPMSFGQSCTDTMETDTTVSFTKGRITTTYDGHGTLQLEPQSGGNFSNVGRIKVEENYIVNYGPIETHHLVTYYWMDHTTVNLTKQPIAIISIHDWIDLNGDPQHEKYALMRQVLFTNADGLNLNESNVSVYPSPFNEVLNVSLPSLNSAVDIQLCDITGRAMKSVHLEKSAGEREESIDVRNLTDGIYLAKITSSEGSVVKRIVKE